MGSRHIFQKTGTQSRRAPRCLSYAERPRKCLYSDDLHRASQKKTAEKDKKAYAERIGIYGHAGRICMDCRYVGTKADYFD